MDWIDPPPASGTPVDVAGVVLPEVGEVISTADPDLLWQVVGLPEETDVGVIDDFFRELSASDCSPQTLRSYAFDLLRWWRFLALFGSTFSTLSLRSNIPPLGKRRS